MISEAIFLLPLIGEIANAKRGAVSLAVFICVYIGSCYGLRIFCQKGW